MKSANLIGCPTLSKAEMTPLRGGHTDFEIHGGHWIFFVFYNWFFSNTIVYIDLEWHGKLCLAYR